MSSTFQRVPPLAGARNFRDLGGYPTEDGRRVKWGVLYRSGVMSSLTAEDVAHLSGRGVAIICDLRTPQEQAADPTPEGVTAGPYRAWDQDPGHNLLAAVAMRPDATAEDIRGVMVSVYEDMPFRYAEVFGGVFGHIIAGDLPMIFHCTGGKDRTGVLASLIMSALSVPRSVVVEDYVLTNELLDTEKLLAKVGPGQAAAGFGFIGSLPPELRAPLMTCEPDYVDATLAAVERRCGSIPAYLHEMLGVDAAGLQTLRERLLETA